MNDKAAVVAVTDIGRVVHVFAPFDDIFEAESWCDYDGADLGEQYEMHPVRITAPCFAGECQSREMNDDFNDSPKARETREKLFQKCQEYVSMEDKWLSEAALETIEEIERRLSEQASC